MDAFSCHSHLQSTHYFVWNPSTEPSKPTTTVQLQFVCSSVHRLVAFADETQTTSEAVYEIDDPHQFESIINVHRSTLSSHDFYDIVYHKLLEYRQWGGLELIIPDIIQCVRRLINTDTHCNVVRIAVDFHQYHICYDNILLRDLMQQYFDEENCGMKPASKSAAMEMLKRVDFDENQIHSGDDEDTCTVCLEELGREEVLCMPCSHRFHGECILKWLDNSHYCPICRFEIPTQ